MFLKLITWFMLFFFNLAVKTACYVVDPISFDMSLRTFSFSFPNKIMEHLLCLQLSYNGILHPYGFLLLDARHYNTLGRKVKVRIICSMNQWIECWFICKGLLTKPLNIFSWLLNLYSFSYMPGTVSVPYKCQLI